MGAPPTNALDTAPLCIGADVYYICKLLRDLEVVEVRWNGYNTCDLCFESDSSHQQQMECSFVHLLPAAACLPINVLGGAIDG